MPRRVLIWIAWLTWMPASAPGQPAPIEPPVIGRPPAFSGIVGGYEIEATAAPTEVRVEEPITLRIVIRGDGPAKYQPKSEHLHLFPAAWDDDFYIEERRAEHRIDRAKRIWQFVYRLRPKHAGVEAIDNIKLVYFNPDSAEKNKFETRYAEPIKIIVKPRIEPAEQTAIDAPIAPESVYQVTPIDAARRPFEFTRIDLAGFLLLPPIACMAGVWAWRRYRPDEQERRRRLRDRSAALATGKLRGAEAPVWETLADYLQDRFSITFEEPTPAEVSAALVRRGFARQLCAQAASLLAVCDAQRFGGALAPRSLAEDAQQLIAALEADPCAR